MTDDLHYIFLEVPKCQLRPEASLIEKFGYALDKILSLEEKPAELEGEIFDLFFPRQIYLNLLPRTKSNTTTI